MNAAAIVHRARAISRLALVGLFGLAAPLVSGCIIVHDHDDCWDGYCDDDYYYDDPYWDGEPDRPLDEPVVVSIDVGEQVGSVEPGAGAGVFVETDEAGRWRIYVACDTDVSGYECGYELYVQGDGVAVETAQELETNDDFDSFENEVDLYFVTTNDFDGVELRAAPGATLTLEMYLDGTSQPELVYWVGDGVQNEGAPTNPIIFSPREPDEG